MTYYNRHEYSLSYQVGVVNSLLDSLREFMLKTQSQEVQNFWLPKIDVAGETLKDTKQVLFIEDK